MCQVRVPVLVSGGGYELALMEGLSYQATDTGSKKPLVEAAMVFSPRLHPLNAAGMLRNVSLAEGNVEGALRYS